MGILPLHAGRWLLCLATVLAIGLLAVACGSDDESETTDGAATSPAAGSASGAASAKTTVIGFLYVGAVDDGGYNQAAYQGQLAVEKLPNVKAIKAENVPESAEAERVMEQMIQQGATIIFPTSFGHLDPAIKVGEKYPNVTFLHQGGLKTAKNVGTYFGASWEANYLAGIAAGKATKSNKLGYVVAFPISQTLLNINAFELGAKSVNAAATTTVVFTANWCDPAKISESVKNLKAQGVDVLNQHQDCPGAGIQAAEKAGMFSVGYHVDGSKLAPNGWLTAATWDWAKLFVDLVNQVRGGTYKVSQVRLSMADGAVKLAPFGKAVPKDVRDQIAATQAKLLSGQLQIFAGPIKDQSGAERIAAGAKQPEVTSLEQMNYLVEGVIGKIPN
ncbi:MAG: BMP family ABC transporter substrate-binding protein [Candidatus Rokubacteria bacterium]|nr:BMP family ABC transporter substrate-binding protein [Chloroflexota bacterium]MBM4442723.1 BMP family ABC transporter substrate-binding protein [Candidatus Rokubacteria bacterium]